VSCAPKGTLPVTATDALLCLKKAVGQGVNLNCPCTGTTSTTSPTTTTSRPDDVDHDDHRPAAAASRSAKPTTTTVARSATPPARTIRMPSFAGDLAGKGDNLVPDLGTIDGDMDGIMLSDPELANMAAFLDSLE
jgi:hypothetical protein